MEIPTLIKPLCTAIHTHMVMNAANLSAYTLLQCQALVGVVAGKILGIALIGGGILATTAIGNSFIYKNMRHSNLLAKLITRIVGVALVLTAGAATVGLVGALVGGVGIGCYAAGAVVTAVGLLVKGN